MSFPDDDGPSSSSGKGSGHIDYGYENLPDYRKVDWMIKLNEIDNMREFLRTHALPEEGLPLQAAIQRSRDGAMVKLLLDHGCSFVTIPGASPYLFQCLTCRAPVDSMRHLVNAGASVNEKNTHGNTLLYVAVCDVTRLDVIEFVISCRPDLNARSTLGRTAIHRLFYNTMIDLGNRYQVFIRLCNAGASIFATDSSGRAVEHYIDDAWKEGRIRDRATFERYAAVIIRLHDRRDAEVRRESRRMVRHVTKVQSRER